MRIDHLIMNIMKTKQQRAKKYLSAAKYFAEKKNVGGTSGFCDLISGKEANDLEIYYPEYYLFKPKQDLIYWFPISDHSSYPARVVQEERVIALLLCYEMCKS